MHRAFRSTLPLGLALALAAPLAAFADTVETVTISIGGGPNAGKHEAATEKGGCTYGFAGPGSWGNQLSQPKEKDPKKLNSVQLVVPDAKKAAAGTGEFLLTVGFGPLLHRSAEYTVDTRNGGRKGSGKVTVQDAGKSAVVLISATTADGVKIEGRIDCKSVMRNGG